LEVTVKSRLAILIPLIVVQAAFAWTNIHTTHVREQANREIAQRLDAVERMNKVTEATQRRIEERQKRILKAQSVYCQ
jgi:hypothetical protein